MALSVLLTSPLLAARKRASSVGVAALLVIVVETRLYLVVIFVLPVQFKFVLQILSQSDSYFESSTPLEHDPATEVAARVLAAHPRLKNQNQNHGGATAQQY